MTTLILPTAQFEDSEEETQTTAIPRAQTTTPGGGQETRWEVVAQTPGLAPAQVIVGRLRAEGIPARAWQEGAGQALGLTVGLLGTGYVVVPEALVEQAQAILADQATK